MFVFTIILIYAIIPIFIVVRFYNTTKFANEKWTYLKANLQDGEALFDKNTHRYWEKTQIKADKGKLIKNTIFKMELNSGKAVYSCSDKQGFIYLPPDSKLANMAIMDIDSNTENKYHKYVFYYSIFLVVISFFMPTAIAYYKNANDPIKLKMERDAKLYNSGIKQINKKLDSVIAKQEYIYVYTNDSTLLDEAILKINYDFLENQGGFDFNRTARLASDFESFIADEASLGYKVYIKMSGNWLRVQNLNKSDTILKFELINDYTDQEFKKIKELNSKRKYPSFGNDKVEKHQNDVVVFDLNELKTQEIRDTWRAIMQPRLDFKRDGLRFYFTSFNKQLTAAELKKHIPDFEKMYLKKQKCTNCYIKKIKLIKQFSD